MHLPQSLAYLASASSSSTHSSRAHCPHSSDFVIGPTIPPPACLPLAEAAQPTGGEALPVGLVHRPDARQHLSPTQPVHYLCHARAPARLLVPTGGDEVRQLCRPGNTEGGAVPEGEGARGGAVSEEGAGEGAVPEGKGAGEGAESEEGDLRGGNLRGGGGRGEVGM